MMLALNVTREQIVEDPSILEALISADKETELKSIRIPESNNYYFHQNDIVNREVTFWDPEQEKLVEDLSKANNKLPHGYHAEVVDVATNYLTSLPIEITFPKEFSDEKIKAYNDMLNNQNQMQEQIKLMLKNGQLHSKSWLYFYNKDGEFMFDVFEALGIIDVYSTDVRPELKLIIRYYTLQVWNEGRKEFDTVYYGEVYDNAIKSVFKADGDKSDYEHVNDVQLLSTDTIEEVATLIEGSEDGETKLVGTVVKTVNSAWSVVPFVKFELNEEDYTMLANYKYFIDSMDVIVSDFANNLEDVQDVIWILKNYKGQDIDEFMHDLKKKKAIPIGEGGDVKTERVDIPHAARKEMRVMLEAAIYKFGMSVNFDMASISNVATETLKIMFSRLDLKSDGYETKLKEVIMSIFDFSNDFIKYADAKDGLQEIATEDVTIDFNRNVIINESELIDNLVKSEGMISSATILKRHPYVENAQLEQEALDAEGELIIDDPGNE